jgi:ubiquinol-cytochrome c reductase cytochrome c subunit
MFSKHIVLAVALFACAATCTAQAPEHAPKHGAAADGQAVFMRIGCYTCHGTVGQGGAGVRLAPNTIPLEAFRTWVRNGSPGWTIARGMPAFPPSIISDAELAEVRAYLAGLPAPPAANDIPLLRR